MSYGWGEYDRKVRSGVSDGDQESTAESEGSFYFCLIALIPRESEAERFGLEGS